jgi:Uma2 family endonuclease
VLAAKQQVECFTQPAGDAYTQSRIYRPGETLASAALAGLSVSLNTLFLPLVASQASWFQPNC